MHESESMKTTAKQFPSPSSLRTDFACLVLAVIVAGCVGRGPTTPSRPVVEPQPRRMEPAASQFGPAPAKVVSVNPDLGFVVVDFSSRVMPPVGTRLNVYRADKNTGAVRITEPVRSRLATADIVQGEVHVGDEAR
jgi:hypothetical protein